MADPISGMHEVTPQSPGYGAVNFFQNHAMPPALLQYIAQARQAQEGSPGTDAVDSLSNLPGVTPGAMSAIHALALQNLPARTPNDSRVQALSRNVYNQQGQ